MVPRSSTATGESGMQPCSLLAILTCLFVAGECYTCPAPEFLSHDGVVFTPNQVHVSRGDQAIVQCVVEYYQQSQPQTFLYVNDCKMMGFDHPSWVTRIMQTDGPCSHTDTTKFCRTLTMYINGTAEAHQSRVYCCARLGGRVCSPNSTVSVVDPPQPSPTYVTESSAEGCVRPPKPTTSLSPAVPSETPTVAPSGMSTAHQLTTDPSITAETDFEFSGASQHTTSVWTLTLLLSVLASSLTALFL